MHALVVPRMPLVSQPLETLPETPATMSLDRLIERVHHGRIARHAIDALPI
jgi:hypothetical protein